EYVSPLARAQRAGEGAAIVRALESLAPLGAIKPEIYDNIDADAAARLLAQSFGVPNNLLRTPDAVKKFRKEAEKKAPAPADGMAGLGDLGAMLSGDAASGGAA
ncbi:portal protein, partial [Ferrovibrio sp.]|uniref:portal protein n=1 Tax=Ferrovibrio sp. TaxID=1917215 RepID=UPI0035B33C44